jgi:hypothetical protein
MNELGEKFRMLHNEEVYDLCRSPSIVRILRAVRILWAGQVAGMGEVRKVIYSKIAPVLN